MHAFWKLAGRRCGVVGVLGLLCGGVASAQEPALAASGSRPAAPKFAPAVRVFAGEVELGAKRLYPSPVFHDHDGDGRADLVVGDLRGRITVALRTADAGEPRYAAEKPLKGRDGKDLDFANW